MKRILVALLTVGILVILMSIGIAEGSETMMEEPIFRARSNHSFRYWDMAYNDDCIVYITRKQRTFVEDEMTFYRISTDTKKTEVIKKMRGCYLFVSFIEDGLFVKRWMSPKPFLQAYEERATFFSFPSIEDPLVLEVIDFDAKTEPRIIEMDSLGGKLYAYVTENSMYNLYRYDIKKGLTELVIQNCADRYPYFLDSFIVIGDFNLKQQRLIPNSKFITNDSIINLPEGMEWEASQNAILKDNVLYYTLNNGLYALDFRTWEKTLIWQFASDRRYFVMEGNNIYMPDDTPFTVMEINVLTGEINRYSVTLNQDDFTNEFGFIVIKGWLYLLDSQTNVVNAYELVN